jgi:hypothetical protein
MKSAPDFIANKEYLESIPYELFSAGIMEMKFRRNITSSLNTHGVADSCWGSSCYRKFDAINGE